MTRLYVVDFSFVFRDSPSSYRRKDSMGQSTVSNHNRSESATIGKQNRYQTTTLTRFGDSLSHRNPYPVSHYSRWISITFHNSIVLPKQRGLIFCGNVQQHIYIHCDPSSNSITTFTLKYSL